MTLHSSLVSTHKIITTLDITVPYNASAWVKYVKARLKSKFLGAGRSIQY